MGDNVNLFRSNDLRALDGDDDEEEGPGSFEGDSERIRVYTLAYQTPAF